MIEHTQRKFENFRLEIENSIVGRSQGLSDDLPLRSDSNAKTTFIGHSFQ